MLAMATLTDRNLSRRGRSGNKRRTWPGTLPFYSQPTLVYSLSTPREKPSQRYYEYLYLVMIMSGKKAKLQKTGATGSRAMFVKKICVPVHTDYRLTFGLQLTTEY